VIKARIKAQNRLANLKDYKDCYRKFSWAEIEKIFTWYETGCLNIVHEAIDRWADNPEKKDQKALIFEAENKTVSFTYQDLKDKSCQWANLFLHLGLNSRDRIFVFLPPCPEIYFAILGCIRVGIVFSPLYSSLNYDELEGIITNGKPRCVLTNSDLAEVLPVDVMDSVYVVGFVDDALPGIFKKEVSVLRVLEQMEKTREPVWLREDFPLFLIYTSGSTGPPKGVVHSHKDMAGQLATGKYVLDLTSEDILWTDGEPAWITGTVYGMFVPWLCGVTSVVQGDPFSASTWYRTLEQHHVSVWYTTPATIKLLMRAGEDLPTRYNLSALRHIVTVGKHLGPDLFYWVCKNLGLSPHDTWWMSETGVICLANFPSMDIKPGSMGKPVPGIEAVVMDEDGNILPPLTMGELALRVPWPGLMICIWGDKERYQEYFRVKGWFLTGDMVLKDEEGYYYHQGRMDDLIKVGDKRVGPFEIEHVLCQHPAVWEAAVISLAERGKDPELKTFVVLKKQVVASNRIKQEIKAFVRANFSPGLPLKHIEILDKLPRTASGKLLRRVLRARELGLPSEHF